MKKGLIVACCLISAAAFSQKAKEFRTPLMYSSQPVPNGITEPERVANDNGLIVNISEAELRVFLPESTAPTACVVICPGGGYKGEAIVYEGEKVARMFAENGIAGVVLKYRLPNGNHEIPITDAQNALRQVRLNAKAWNIDPARVGIIGFSAGGHLASMASVHYREANPSAKHELEQFSSRPDFSILVYPVISMDLATTHQGSRINMTPDNPSQELLDYLSAEKNVDNDTPPAYIVFANDDPTVNPMNGTAYYDALRKKSIPAVLHIYESGGHGFSFRPQQPDWIAPLLTWSYLK